jgi:hypothetical protein
MKDPTVTELLADHQGAHSDFQMDHLIGDADDTTTYGRYKQALRELHGRRKNLRYGYNKLAGMKIELAEKEAREPTPQTAVQIQETKLHIEYMEEAIAETEREFLRFYAQAVTLKKSLGGVLSNEKKAELDEEMHLSKNPALKKKLKGKESPFKGMKISNKPAKELVEGNRL